MVKMEIYRIRSQDIVRKMDFTKLTVWQNSRCLANSIYILTSSFPKEEVFGLTSQMRRAAISVPSNIAEGCGRSGVKEVLHFLHIARGSLFELETQCYLALDQDYLNDTDFKIISNQIQDCKRLLNGYINYHRNKLNK